MENKFKVRHFLQEAVTLAMKQWLNENKQDVLAALKQSLAESRRFNLAKK